MLHKIFFLQNSISSSVLQAVAASLQKPYLKLPKVLLVADPYQDDGGISLWRKSRREVHYPTVYISSRDLNDSMEGQRFTVAKTALVL
jgi:hypothetical protein